MHRFRIDPATVDAVVISHLHGDHFGGLPFLLLDAAFITRRKRPLMVAGPAGIANASSERRSCCFRDSGARLASG